MSLRNEAADRTKSSGKFAFSAFDSHKREAPADASPEALQAQTAAYLARGGQIHQMPMGASAQSLRDPLRPDRQRASAGGKKGGAAKKGLPNRGKKSEIRMEDGL